MMINCYLSVQFRLMLSHDGSGKGAALVAAVADRVLQQKKQQQQALANGMNDLSVSQ